MASTASMASICSKSETRRQSNNGSGGEKHGCMSCAASLCATKNAIAIVIFYLLIQLILLKIHRRSNWALVLGMPRTLGAIRQISSARQSTRTRVNYLMFLHTLTHPISPLKKSSN